MYNERRTEAVRILTLGMRVIPVRAGLVDLEAFSNRGGRWEPMRDLR